MDKNYYQEAKRLLLQLHEMYLQGTDQTPAANRIRADMEIPERHLTKEQQERLDGLSGDLYSLTGEEVNEHSDFEVTQQKISRIWMSSDWDGALKLLRGSCCSNVPEHIVAILRADFWKKLGDNDVSLLFAEHAARLKPGDIQVRAIVLLRRLDLGLPVDPVELSTIAVQAGCKGTTREKQIESIRNAESKFQFREPLLQPA